MTGLSRQQVTRLVGRYRKGGKLSKQPRAPRQGFTCRYIAADVALLAETDVLHGTLSGPTTKKLMERAHQVFGDPRYERLAGISVSHLYNLRGSKPYQNKRLHWTKTNPAGVPIGTRRAPQLVAVPVAPVEAHDRSREQDIAGLDWPQLKAQVKDCAACRLRAGCTQTVFGVGDEQAEWLFVGEGPGADEDAQGEPFVGQAGKLLDNMLLAIGLRRGQNVYIANIVKCRPSDNRTPGADEIATTALLGRDAALGSLRGTLHDFKLPAAEFSGAQEQESSQPSSLPHPPTSPHRVGTIPLIVTYHPAYLLRSPMEKVKAWEDLRLAVSHLPS